ncbi:MAG: radical SAM family heme chaperone HemW [Clostridia bacterium]
MKNIGIYIHFPFCKSKCIYCNFLSYPQKEALIPEYVSVVNEELKLWSEKTEDFTISSVYFGGGTPSLMTAKQLKSIMTTLKEKYALSKDCEISMEMNPASNTAALISRLTDCGINRVSVGLQTDDDYILREIKRPHTTKDYILTIKRLKNAGIKNISTDIILGLPHQNNATVKHTLQLLVDLQIPHISAYGLKVEKGTPLYKLVRDGIMLLPEEDETVDMYDLVFKTLEKQKIYRYEVSNFAKVGYECKHNINYWEQGRYLGVGLNASGFIGDTRYTNLQDMDKYIQRVKEGKRPESKRHKLSLKETEFEYLMLSLRMERGMDIDKFNEIYYTDFLSRYKTVINKLEKIGVIVYDNHNISVRSEKMYLLNSVLVEFMED